MGEEAYKKIFSSNLRRLMNEHGKSQIDLINDLGFNKSAVSTWVNGTRLPRMDKVQQLANYFHCQRSDLIEDKSDQDTFLPLTAAEESHMRKYRKLSDTNKVRIDERIDILLEEEREDLKRVSVS